MCLLLVVANLSCLKTEWAYSALLPCVSLLQQQPLGAPCRRAYGHESLAEVCCPAPCAISGHMSLACLSYCLVATLPCCLAWYDTGLALSTFTHIWILGPYLRGISCIYPYTIVIQVQSVLITTTSIPLTITTPSTHHLSSQPVNVCRLTSSSHDTTNHPSSPLSHIPTDTSDNNRLSAVALLRAVRPLRHHHIPRVS